MYQNDKDFVSSILSSKEPTLLFRGGDRVFDRDVEIEDIFPVQFPFGIGGVHMKNRPTQISKADILQHYSIVTFPFHNFKEVISCLSSVLCIRGWIYTKIA